MNIAVYGTCNCHNFQHALNSVCTFVISFCPFLFCIPHLLDVKYYTTTKLLNESSAFYKYMYQLNLTIEKKDFPCNDEYITLEKLFARITKLGMNAFIFNLFFYYKKNLPLSRSASPQNFPAVHSNFPWSAPLNVESTHLSCQLSVTGKKETSQIFFFNCVLGIQFEVFNHIAMFQSYYLKFIPY